MKRNLKRLCVLSIIVSPLITVGCTSGELMKARDANDQLKRRFNERVEKYKTLSSINDRLRRDMAIRDETSAAIRKENELYSAQCAKQQESLTTLKALYDAELARKPVLEVGSGPLPGEIDRALSAFARANPDLLEYQSKYGMVKLKSDMSFASGSAEVKPGASTALGRLVEILKAPVAANFHLYVAGHTDNVPIGASAQKHPTNWYLSVHRAIGIQKVLVAAGMPASRIGVMGFGEHHPIVPNNPDKKGTATNRRVELWILPPGRLLTRPMTGGGK